MDKHGLHTLLRHSRSHTRSHTVTHTLSHSNTHTHTLTLSHSDTLTLSRSHALPLTSLSSLSRSHTHTLTLSHVDSTLPRHFLLSTMRVLINVLLNTLAPVSARARFTSSTWSSTLCGCPFFDSLFLALFLSVCFSYPNIPLALRQMRSPAPWPKTPLSQVMSPTSLTNSTTRRLLKSSCRSNPATRSPRTSMTRNSMTRPSAEHSLHHCSFRSEKNQRIVDKLITLLKKVCCHLSPCLSVCHARTGRPVHELSSLGSRSREKPSRDSENKQIKVILESLILEQRFTNTSSKPIQVGELTRN